MKWTKEEYENQPTEFVDTIILMLREENEARARAINKSP